jgi:hypothetical protein
METSTGNTTILRQDKAAPAKAAQESRRMVKTGLPTTTQAPFLFRHFRLYARIRLTADPPRALLDDIPACAITLLTGDPDVDHR